MPRFFTVVTALAASGVLPFATGCVTHVTSTAPGPQEGTMYVTGFHSGKPVLWLCPATPSKGECQLVDVEESER